MKTNKRQFLSRLRHMGVTVTLALLMLALSLAVLQWTVLARVKSSGAGGCENFIDAVNTVENGDTIAQMFPEKPTDGAVISKNIIVQGGWDTGTSGGCSTVGETVFTDSTTMEDLGFTFDAPALRSVLYHDAGPVLTLDPSVVTLTLQHLIIEQRGLTTTMGGGISGVISDGAKVRLENVVFTNSTTTDEGGGLYLEVRGGSQLVISDSMFFDNLSGAGGGFEIRVYDNSQVLIHNTQVTSNSALTGTGGGGRILIDSGVVTLQDSTFTGNQASGSGGDLAIERIGSGPASVYFLNSTVGDLDSELPIFNTQLFLPVVLKDHPPAAITGISLSGSTYVVSFQTLGFTPQLPGQHVHFFFDTVPPEQAGVPGSGPWKVYGSSSPFTGYTTADKPAGATQMCILVANPDHSVQQGTGNCYPLP